MPVGYFPHPRSRNRPTFTTLRPVTVSWWFESVQKGRALVRTLTREHETAFCPRTSWSMGRGGSPKSRAGRSGSKFRHLSGQLLLERAGRSAGGFHSVGALTSRAEVFSATLPAHSPGKRPLWRVVFLCHQRVPDLHAVFARRGKNREDRSLEILRAARPAVATALLPRLVPARDSGFWARTIHAGKSGSFQRKAARLFVLLQQLAGYRDARAFFLRVVAGGGRAVLSRFRIAAVLRQPPRGYRRGAGRAVGQSRRLWVIRQRGCELHALARRFQLSRTGLTGGSSRLRAELPGGVQVFPAVAGPVAGARLPRRRDVGVDMRACHAVTELVGRPVALFAHDTDFGRPRHPPRNARARREVHDSRGANQLRHLSAPHDGHQRGEKNARRNLSGALLLFQFDHGHYRGVF